MAYFNQERKKAMAPKVNAILKKYGLKGSLAVRHHSTVVLSIREGNLDFIGNFSRKDTRLASDGYIQVNTYHTDRGFTGAQAEFFKEVLNVLNGGNHDRSDIMTDYFDVGWYVNINVGSFEKPYKLIR